MASTISEAPLSTGKRTAQPYKIRFMAAFFGCLFATVSHAQWQITKSTDPISDDERVQIVTHNAEGDTVELFYMEPGTALLGKEPGIWLRFTPKAGVMAGEHFVLRVDKNAPIDYSVWFIAIRYDVGPFKVERNRTFVQAVAEPATPSGPAAVSKTGPLAQLLGGHKLIVRQGSEPPGLFRDAEFAIGGDRNALLAALGFRWMTDAEEMAFEKEYR